MARARRRLAASEVVPMSGQSPSRERRLKRAPEEARAALVEVMRDVGLYHFYTNKSYCTCGWGPGSVPEHSRHVESERLDAALAARTEVECEHISPDLVCNVCQGSGSRSLYLLDVIRGTPIERTAT